MENNKFKTYQMLHKKLASAFFEDDKKVRGLVDKLVDMELNKPGMWNSVTKPFKKLYLGLSNDKENMVQGIKNLGSGFIDAHKNILADYASTLYSNALSNLPLSDKLNYFGSAAKSLVGKGGEAFNDFNKKFLDENISNILENSKKHLLPKGLSKDDFISALRSGEFNKKQNANNFLNALKGSYKNTVKDTQSNWLYKTLANSAIANKLNKFEDLINQKLASADANTDANTQKDEENPIAKANPNISQQTLNADAKRVQEMCSNPTFRSSMGVAAAGKMGVNPNRTNAVEGPGMNNDSSGADWLNARADMNATGSILDGHLSNYNARTGYGSRAFFNSLTDLLKNGEYDRATSLWHSGKQRGYFNPSQRAFYDKLGPSYRFNESNASSFLDQYPRE